MWRDLPANPLWILWHSWNLQLNRFLLRDAVVNISLYVPLGMSAYLAFRKLYLPVLLGFLLSVSMELMQLFVPQRNTSATDVLMNVTGTVAGVILGLLFEKMAGPEQASFIARLSKLKAADRAALMLLFIWAGYLLFPFFPLVGLYTPFQRLKYFGQSPLFAAIPLISGTVSWLAAGKLMDAAGIRASRWCLAVSILAIPAQFFIVNRQPAPSDLLGALAGFLLFVGLGRIRTAGHRVAAAFLLAILFRGFSPFHFVPQPSGFGWIPFGGFLRTEWQRGILLLLEKSFYYGTAIWLLHACGVRFTRAAAILAVELTCIEIAQVHLPGRTPEITDPLLAIVLAFALAILSRETHARAVG